MSRLYNLESLLVGLHRHLVSKPEVVAALGVSDVGTWLFRRRLYARVENSGDAAAVLTIPGPWSARNRHNTLQFPELQVEVYADVDRDPKEYPADHHVSPDDRCYAVHEAIDPYMHWTDRTPQTFNGVRVIGSTCQGDMRVDDVPGGDGMVRGLVSYSLEVG